MNVGRRIRVLAWFLAGANVLVWIWAWAHAGERGAVLATAALAYGFGLRHALDADHIAAIDNVTRKMMQEGQQPVMVGFFFALGHSFIVLLASAMLALSTRVWSGWMPLLQQMGGPISAWVSASFLLCIGLFNAVILFDTIRASNRQVTDTAAPGVLARLYTPLFKHIGRSWQMAPLGFLFGLGFETATEVTVLGTSAMHAAQGVDFQTIMLFPSLFTVGMLTMDAIDGVLMLRVYGWAFVEPQRKRYYNLALTFVSTALALAIGLIGVIGAINTHGAAPGFGWFNAATIQEKYGELGYITVAVLLSTWLLSILFFRSRPALQN